MRRCALCSAILLGTEARGPVVMQHVLTPLEAMRQATVEGRSWIMSYVDVQPWELRAVPEQVGLYDGGARTILAQAGPVLCSANTTVAEAAVGEDCMEYGPLISLDRVAERCELVVLDGEEGASTWSGRSLQKEAAGRATAAESSPPAASGASPDATAAVIATAWVPQPALSASVSPELYWLGPGVRLKLQNTLVRQVSSKADPARTWPALRQAPAAVQQEGLAAFSRRAWDAARSLLGPDAVHGLDAHLWEEEAVVHVTGLRPPHSAPTGSGAAGAATASAAARGAGAASGQPLPYAHAQGECMPGDWRIRWSEWRLPRGPLRFLVRPVGLQEDGQDLAPAPPAPIPDLAASEAAARSRSTGTSPAAAGHKGQHQAGDRSEGGQGGLGGGVVADVTHWWPADTSWYKFKDVASEVRNPPVMSWVFSLVDGADSEAPTDGAAVLFAELASWAGEAAGSALRSLLSVPARRVVIPWLRGAYSLSSSSSAAGSGKGKSKSAAGTTSSSSSPLGALSRRAGSSSAGVGRAEGATVPDANQSYRALPGSSAASAASAAAASGGANRSGYLSASISAAGALSGLSTPSGSNSSGSTGEAGEREQGIDRPQTAAEDWADRLELWLAGGHEAGEEGKWYTGGHSSVAGAQVSRVSTPRARHRSIQAAAGASGGLLERLHELLFRCLGPGWLLYVMMGGMEALVVLAVLHTFLQDRAHRRRVDKAHAAAAAERASVRAGRALSATAAAAAEKAALAAAAAAGAIGAAGAAADRREAGVATAATAAGQGTGEQHSPTSPGAGTGLTAAATAGYGRRQGLTLAAVRSSRTVAAAGPPSSRSATSGGGLSMGSGRSEDEPQAVPLSPGPIDAGALLLS